MSEEKELPEVKADKKVTSKKEEAKLEVVQPVQSPKSGACSCGCQEKLQKLVEALCEASPSIARTLKEKNII